MDRAKGLSRRDLLRLALALTAAGAAMAGSPAQASVENATKLMNDLTGGKAPTQGKIKIDMPQIAENGNTVPMTISVDSPMTEQNYVKAIHVIADGNPSPEVASFKLTPLSGKAEVSTRMRMARTQNIWAVAEMNDGSTFMEKTEVKVTIGGCGG